MRPMPDWLAEGLVVVGVLLLALLVIMGVASWSAIGELHGQSRRLVHVHVVPIAGSGMDLTLDGELAGFTCNQSTCFVLSR